MDKFETSMHLIVYNGANWLPWCLESIKNQTNQNFFLLIIDNNSIDSSYDICQSFLEANPQLGKRARLIKNKQNIGFARSHNQAISWTESEFVFMLNQDVYLLPDYLEKLSASLKNQERAAAVSGKLLVWQFEPEVFHSTHFKSQPQKVIDSLGLVIKRSRQVINISQGQIDDSKSNIPKRIFGVPATASLYSRQALLAVSLAGQVFDEDFVSYKEDVDLSWRLQLGGYEAWLEPSAVAYHDRSLSSGYGIASEYKLRQNRTRDLKVFSWSNHLAVLVKNDSLLNFCHDLPWILAHEFAKALFLLITDPITLFKGKFRFLKLLPKFYQKRRQLKASHKVNYRELRRWWSKTKLEVDKL